MNIKGYFLTIFTLGIYSFWWQKDLFNFYINNLYIERNGSFVECKSKATGSGFFGLMIVNFLILIITLGLGYPWVMTRTLTFVFQNIDLRGNLPFTELQQVSADFDDATGEGFTDFFDFGFII